MTTKGKIGIIAALIICVALFGWLNHMAGESGKPPAPPKPIVLPDDLKLLKDNWSSLIANAAGPPLGNPNAPWTVIEFGDFQCPQCGKAHEYAERMVQKSNGHVKLYFFNFPLVNIHAHAHGAALAGLAAANQGKFWDLYESMYTNQNQLSDAGIAILASSVHGLDWTKFHADWYSPATAAKLSNSVALANTVKIEITPTFVLRRSNGGPVDRFVGMFGQKIDPQYPGLYDLMAQNPWHANYDSYDLPDESREQ